MKYKLKMVPAIGLHQTGCSGIGVCRLRDRKLFSVNFGDGALGLHNVRGWHYAGFARRTGLAAHTAFRRRVVDSRRYDYHVSLGDRRSAAQC